MNHRSAFEAKEIGVDQRTMIPIVPAPDDWSIGRWAAPARAISGTGETATELMLPRRDKRSDVEGGEHLDQVGA
jgi:hypothetical protein